MSEMRVLDVAFVADDPDNNPEDSAMQLIHRRVER